MIRHRIVAGLLMVAASLLGPEVASAEQKLTFGVGHFGLRGEDARVEQDVLVTNLELLDFDLKDFNGGNVFGDWVVDVGDYIEVGAGIEYYRRSVPSVYRGFVNTDGSEIEQSLRLRVIPISGTVRVRPLGLAGVEPYVGAGLAVFSYRYSETGQFVDFRDRSIFRDRFVASGNSVGPVVLGGIRIPVGSTYLVGGEVRYQHATGNAGVDNGFVDEKLDLGGVSLNFTFSARF